jgi:hypothetical protein
MDFSKFNKAVDLEALKKDIQEAEENGGNGDYKEVPVGTYEVKIEKMELKESKKGDPMLSVWFKILNGEYEGSMIFMNQVITQGFQIHICNTFLRSLDTGLDIVFDDFEQYANLIMDVHEKVDSEKLEFALNYGKTDKGFSTFEITEVFETN